MNLKILIIFISILVIGCAKHNSHISADDDRIYDISYKRNISIGSVTKDYGLIYCLSKYSPNLNKTQELTIAYEEYKSATVLSEKFKNIEIFFESKITNPVSSYFTSDINDGNVKAVFMECMGIYNSKEYEMFLQGLILNP